MSISTLNDDLNILQNLAIPAFEEDVDVIQKLDDEPNDVGGLSAAELKAKFDEAGNRIKTYLNETLVPSISETVAEAEKRAEAEAARVLAEEQRATAEQERVSAEAEREQAEAERRVGEAARVSAEEERAAAETARKEAEAARALAEQNRVDTDSGIVAQATKAAEDAETAKDNAEKAAETASSAAIHQPIVGDNQNWWTWNIADGAYVDTGIYAAGHSPYIGNNGDWWIGAEDTGVAATGPQGPQGIAGPAGPQGIQGIQGQAGLAGSDGKDGVGIQSVEQTTTSTEDGGTNVVTVTKTDGTTSTFYVRNGSQGSTGPAGPQGSTGPAGPQGPKGDTGSGFKVLDYYATLDALEAAVTSPIVGDAYGVGTGEPYDIYIYGETIGWVNNGPLQGAKGDTGQDGVSPSVSVSEITGGHRVSIQDADGTSSFDVMDGVDGQDGAAGAGGITPTIGANGNWYLGDTDTGKPSRGEAGPQGIAGPQGETGPTGAAGYTPVRGTDYWTAEDQQTIVDAVLAALPAAEGVSV